MRRIAFLLCLVAATGLTPACGIIAGAKGTGPAVRAEYRPIYPAVRTWVAGHNRAAVGCLVLLVRSYNRRLAETGIMALVEAILAASLRHDLDPLLVASVIAAESSFNPRARSSCGAEGLMQITRPLQPWVGVRDPYDIEENVAGGCRYLASLHRRFGRLDLALAAYNAGPSRVARLGRVPEIEETKRYVGRVIGLHRRLVARTGELSARPDQEGMRDPFVLA